MQKGRYPDKWARNKYNGHDLPPAPYTAAGKDVGAIHESPAVDPVAPPQHTPVEPPVGGGVPDAPEANSAPQQNPPVCPAGSHPPLTRGANPFVEPTDSPPLLKESGAKRRGDLPLQREETATSHSSRPHQGQLAQRQPQPQETGIICGKNAVVAALRSGQSVNRVLLAEGLSGAFATEVVKRCREHGVPYQFVPKARLTLLAGPDHRGVACELSAFNYAEVEDMLELARERGEQPLLLLLDGVEDPHNLGAVIRTAFCVGAHGVIIPKRRAAALNATVAKTSAGASAYLPVARVANLAQTACALKEAGLWLAAADMDGQTAWRATLDGPLALVLGGEDRGVSPLLKQQCDLCISLPMAGSLGSLNVSAAAAALLYEICRQRAE